MHSDFISAALNASRGRGRLLFEAYCHSRPSEEDAVSYLNDRVVDTMERFNEYFPNVAAGTGMLFGNFNQIPIISLDVNPEVDYKYYLDMQLQPASPPIPVFRDLAMTGYWGSYYDDEELYRWSFRLLRHYCVEGNTEMLSKAYGYRYSPGHLRNCDFVDGLAHWTADPAGRVCGPTGSPATGRAARRAGALRGGTGDTFCVFTRGEDRAEHPHPDRHRPDARARSTPSSSSPPTTRTWSRARSTPRQHGPGAPSSAPARRSFPEKSYVFVDRRNSGRKKNDGLVRINLHHIRFRATAPSFTVTFTDAEAEPGTETALNYIMLKPYFEE